MSALTERELLTAELAANGAMLRELTADVPSADAVTPSSPGEWGMIDVVRHLVEGDRDKFLPRVRRILAETEPVFAKVEAATGDASDLPTLVQWSDVLQVSLTTLLLAAAATIYPAWRAARTMPAEALRHD